MHSFHTDFFLRARTKANLYKAKPALRAMIDAEPEQLLIPQQEAFTEKVRMTGIGLNGRIFAGGYYKAVKGHDTFARGRSPGQSKYLLMYNWRFCQTKPISLTIEASGTELRPPLERPGGSGGCCDSRHQARRHTLEACSMNSLGSALRSERIAAERHESPPA